MSETELRLFAVQMSADLFPSWWENKGMKLALMLLSLTVGTAAAVKTVHLMNQAASVMEMATRR